MSDAGDGPLSGLRILDLTHIVAGPYATGLLADLGARVVKVERPQRGDDLRRLPDQVRQISVSFNDLNRNKEGLTLDLRSEQGRELLLALLPHFDVLCENFAAGTMERWDLGWERLRAANPRLVFVSLSGFGRDGPYRGRPSYDLVAQAMGGLMELTGAADGPPTKTGVNLADYVGGMFMAVGILSALHERGRSGEGQHVDISNQDVLTTMLDSAPSPRRFAGALKAIGKEHLYDDPDFRQRARGFRAQDELNGLWSEYCATRTCSEVEEVCLEHGVGFGRVQTIPELVDDPQLAHRGMYQEVEHPDGEGPIPTRGVCLQFLRTPGRIRHAAPMLGEHTEHVLGELLGMTDEEIERLRRSGVV